MDSTVFRDLQECERSDWSVREMKRQISTSLFERLLLSDGKANKPKFTGIFSNYISFSEYEGSF